MIPLRKLKDGTLISVISAGGLMFAGMDQKEVDTVVDNAISKGVRFFDVAPTYGDAEIKLGNSLFGKRDRVLLSCKTVARDKKTAFFELKQSMARLKTDYFDFYVMHGIRDVKKDVETACSNDGMLATAMEAKKNGIVLRIGFSAHTEEAAIAALDACDFDFFMFPVNIFCYLKSGFGKKVIDIAKKKKIDVIGIKAIAFQKWQDNSNRAKYPNCWYQPIEDRETARAALAWTLEQGLVSAIPPAHVKMFESTLDIATDKPVFEPSMMKRIEKLLCEIEPVFP
ncbi:MAG: aldo/keto reductase [Candidatus Omnitrophica bacterium]|nr:aldo/keto reductase [Candidatus Omnitrophota bacterium]